jgi:hypothetical protein
MAQPWSPVVDLQNKLGTQGFARIPWSFRFVINKVLTYREAAVYVQIAMHCGKDEVYHWGLDKIAGCLGWKRTNALYACLNKLVDTGFLIKKVVPLPGARKYRVNVYQRPSVGYTLRQLQSAGYVGPGKLIHPDQFTEAVENYEKRDKLKEVQQFQFNKSDRAGARRIGTKKHALGSM